MDQPALFTHPTRPPDHPTGTGYLPAWVAEQLKTNKEHAASRTAKYHKCRKCRQPILTGLDHDDCAGTVHADPTPITRQDEIMLTVIGRPTYLAIPNPPHGWKLDRRNHEGGIDLPTPQPIFPAHQCGARFPGFAPTPTGGTTDGWDLPETPEW